MRILCVPVLIFFFQTSFGQNERRNDFNNTNWLQAFGTFSINSKWSVHAEYQWRREDGFKSWQQSLARTGVNYKVNEFITAHFGYAWAETFPYGDFPIANSGTFPEHRVYEQATIRQPNGRLLFTHRFRIEQRWVGRVATPRGEKREIETWLFSHRFRYQFRMQYPHLPQRDRYAYAVAADELFVSAGKNVGANTFDQNRIFLLGGYKINRNVSIEGGYFNQTLTQPRKINNAVIMQRNNGFLLSTMFSL